VRVNVLRFATLAEAIIALLFALPSRAQWVYEFEFAYAIRPDRLLAASCTKVVPLVYVANYAAEQRPGWEVSCGNDQPMYTHFLGRRCWKPSPRFQLECGWRHFSSPGDREEISFDALSVRGRFEWGRR
jgi:hypothetical protein